MKNNLAKIILLALTLAFSGCATHSGYMNSTTSLSSGNFKYVKREVQGTAKTIYIFGIGGLHKTALVNEAKRNLLHNYQLQDNQALADLTVSWKQLLVLPFYRENRCTVTASIVQFD
jgi:hypothetical protein